MVVWVGGLPVKLNYETVTLALQVPPEQYGKREFTDDVLYEEENEAIRNCGALSSMLGLMRSFSTSDLDQNFATISEKENIKSSLSEIVLNSWSIMICRIID
ncbi:uncharacterized protein CEXT_578431 [Caerostris extrusa]|uniref:Uncharacterized protein n=1 Tax=Caerostris extrusa TaxID=172846 RepID=A0AAV4W7X9_CAEEX|nr:uncharacterized protein CEXT_578431 [Caerostris extrusa]